MQLPEPLINSAIRLLWRFNKKAEARALVAWVQQTHPARSWRLVEAFLAAENMTDLLAR